MMGWSAGYMASCIMREFTLYLLSDAVQMCLQEYGYTALPFKVRAAWATLSMMLAVWPGVQEGQLLCT